MTTSTTHPLTITLPRNKAAGATVIYLQPKGS
jgi:hypothetical protein